MSERSFEQGASTSSSKYGNNGAAGKPTRSPTSNNAVTSQPRENVRSSSNSPPTGRRSSDNLARGFELPPLPQTSSGTGGRSLPSVTRIGGVASILNPAEADDSTTNRRRKASQLDSPPLSTQSLPPILSGSQASQTTSGFAAQSPGAQYATTTERPPRRIITARSPSLHRAASLGQLNPTPGTISAQTTPFPGSPRGRPYTVEPGLSGAPQLPTPPAAARSGYTFPTPPPPAEVIQRVGARPARARKLSSSASPSTSYSSYSQPGQTSPAVQYDPLSQGPMATARTSGSEGGMPMSSTAGTLSAALEPGRQRQMGIPISSSGGPNVYQMLTLETTSGTVQLPVDVQAASRVADEKRRRNAGASARFRQRRKEKEKEAVTSISRLEQQVKELSEDAEWYRRERDFLAGILSHIPGGERHFPRPASPRHRRVSAASLSGPSGLESAGYTPIQDPGTSPEANRNVRRRTSTFSLPPPSQQPPPPPMPAPGVPIQPNFGQMPPQPSLTTLQSPAGPLPSPLSRGPLPFPGQYPPGQPPQQQHQRPPPHVLQAAPPTGPWNPFTSDRRSSGPPPGQHRDSR